MPLDLELVLTAAALSVLSGSASYLQGCRQGRIKPSFFNLITELSLSLVTGQAVMQLAIWGQVSPPATNAAILVLTLNAAETIDRLKERLLKKIPG
ncbi:hypothetical protein NTE19_003376 [Vibrio fluvialis]|nr:hypothetical protein [Vibrio fluvialis]